MSLGVAGKAHALNTNDFSFDSFKADYYLSRDAGHHSHLKAVEHLVAEFPYYNQNHGIERAIPKTYDKHAVKLHIDTVTDDKGNGLSYTTYDSNDNEVLRIGDADSYVHGRQTYTITYSMQDVTKNFNDHDELFWNTNGTQWQQPFGEVAATLHLDKELASVYNGQLRCLQGAYGASNACQTKEASQGDERIVTFTSAGSLMPRENLSYVAGFKQASFAAYQPTTWERLYPTLLKLYLVLNIGGCIALVIYAVHLARSVGKSAPGKGVIVPEYTPPKDMSVLLSAVTIGKFNKALTAQVIDLAVRHYIKIYEIDRKRLFGKKRSYELEIVKAIDDLAPEEQKFVQMLFGSTEVGHRIDTDYMTKTARSSLQPLSKDMVEQAKTEGIYREDLKSLKKRYYKKAILALILGIVLLSPGVFAGSIVVIIYIATMLPLSEKGAAKHDYLDGLNMYMKLAEAERLRVLQSPGGAEKLPAGTDPSDKKQLVKLYERLLPYAMLYGIEKEWAKQFAVLYDQPPDWYAGNWTTFNAAVFASSFNNFNSMSQTSFAPPNSSSSSGFSGGGFSGGGGGGGGGGGW
jgi:uncharacterized membrane protein YgcG